MTWTPETLTRFWQESDSSFAGDVKAPQVLRLTRRYVKGKVLDVGAGSGALLGQIPEAVGVDLVPRHPRVCQGAAEDLPFSDGQFETVFAIDVLEHVIELPNAIAEVSRVLRKGGYFIAVVPNRENLSAEMVTCPSCNARFHRWGHLRKMCYSQMKEHCALHRLRVVKHGVYPLSLMGQHWLIRRFWPIFVRCGFITASDLLVVAQKC